ncbi:MAG: hypothetical protein HWN81_14315 [Candidatus Lokiarchaeota archaeon]|nr:hypothetical protein [Candidatus Lokiarchaeota archaeon]
MKMMSEKDRKEIISEVQKFGGIGLRRQSLRVHKNGAKFPISKTYIDDELLDPEITYTLILVPEIKIATKTTIALSYFARKKGPLVFYSYPEGILDEGLSIQIANIMDQAFKEGFFVHQSSTVSSSLNYYFEIPSEWARGNKEMLMISVNLDKPTNQLLEESIQEICTDFVLQLKNTKGLFKALYMKVIDKFPEKDHSDIKKINESLRTKIKEFYKEIGISTKQK